MRQSREELNAVRRAYYAATIEKRRQERREWYAANKDKILPQQREYSRKYRQIKKGKINADTAKRRNAQKQRTPSWLKPWEFKAMELVYHIAALKTAVLGETYHVDHIIPLQGELVSGLHVPANLQILSGLENDSKGNRYTP